MARCSETSAEYRGDHHPHLAPARARLWLELRVAHTRLAKLRARAQTGPVTLLYAARDREHNNAVVLAELLHAGES
jgi:uncharacterized protein YeaO (DUF488 family)